MKQPSMPDAERDDAPTTPPRAIRPGGPTSGLREEASAAPVESDVSTTELSVTEPSARDPNTLMSLPKPAPYEDPPDSRLRDLEDRVGAFEGRLSALEKAKDPLASAKATPWWFWLLFLFGLAVTWRLLQALK